ncbi:MAG: helix-turn-helix transcriptional regulator [Cytophagales bacterium]|nr:helix-turn-helix transcriptional regulator [Bernardetiaceae bacterium]MDW8211541.1 helix-turn-helix transcriptional regulator [Cytophagales bacterium]
MEKITVVDSVTRYNERYKIPTYHPLITVFDLSTSVPPPPSENKGKLRFELYAIYLKDSNCGMLRYGRTFYDYQEGTLVFLAPGQIIEVIRDAQNSQPPKGWALIFHPDLLLGTPLRQNIQDYSFFSYSVREALHISLQEREIVESLFKKMRREIERPLDRYTKKLLVSTIGLFLDYCMRFYDRQFITREDLHKGVVEKFNKLLENYYHSGRLQKEGLPSVAQCAEELCFSYKYFGDLIKKQTGKTAQEYIQLWILQLAKEQLLTTEKSISEIAYELGFEYPQHFTRLFKQKVGYTPTEFRLMLN